MLTLLLLFLFNHTSSADLIKTNPIKADPIKDEITKVNSQYGQAYSKGDSSLFLHCYVPDACIMAANTPALCNEDGLLLFYKAGRKMGIRNIVFTTVGLYGETDEYVTEQGVYEMFDADQRSMGKGKYLVLWKRTPEGWKMYRDMFNSNATVKP